MLKIAICKRKFFCCTSQFDDLSLEMNSLGHLSSRRDRPNCCRCSRSSHVQAMGLHNHNHNPASLSMAAESRTSMGLQMSMNCNCPRRSSIKTMNISMTGRGANFKKLGSSAHSGETLRLLSEGSGGASMNPCSGPAQNACTVPSQISCNPSLLTRDLT